MTGPYPRALVVSAVLVAAGAGAGSTGARTAGCERVVPPSRSGSTIVKVIVPANVTAAPGRGTRLWRAPTSTRWGDNPSWLLALGCAVDGEGRRWFRVALPVRPNGSSGWIRADLVLIAHSRYEVEISTSRARVDVYRSGVLVRRARAVVGAPATPTPSGLFAVYDPVPQRRVDGFVGPWVIHLTAQSNVLDNYGGGPGRVAIHGRGGASLRVPLGQAASHGCIRVDNDIVSWLARAVPAGSPVLIAS